MKIIKIEIESTHIIVVRMLLCFLHKVADHGIRNYVENLEMMIDHKWTLAKARRTAAKKYTSSFLQRQCTSWYCFRIHRQLLIILAILNMYFPAFSIQGCQNIIRNSKFVRHFGPNSMPAPSSNDVAYNFFLPIPSPIQNFEIRFNFGISIQYWYFPSNLSSRSSSCNKFLNGSILTESCICRDGFGSFSRSKRTFWFVSCKPNQTNQYLFTKQFKLALWMLLWLLRIVRA